MHWKRDDLVRPFVVMANKMRSFVRIMLWFAQDKWTSTICVIWFWWLRSWWILLDYFRKVFTEKIHNSVNYITEKLQRISVEVKNSNNQDTFQILLFRDLWYWNNPISKNILKIIRSNLFRVHCSLNDSNIYIMIKSIKSIMQTKV